MSITI
jgi:hypothetical protein